MTIDYYNDIISVTTVLGAIALGIFIRDVYKNGKVTIEEHDRYLLFPFSVYIVSQMILLGYMIVYSTKREDVLKYVKSVNFVSKFLSKVPVNKMLKRSNNDINLLNFNAIEETATALDWIILGEMLSEKWLDFTIFGISTSDGSLIKKSMAMGGSILFLVSFIENNN